MRVPAGESGVRRGGGPSVAAQAANSAPTAIDLDNGTVDEDTDGAIVGLLTVTDPDDGDTATFAVDDDRFEVATFGGFFLLKLKEGVLVDFETEATVALEITVTDAGGLFYSESFVIAVNDFDETPGTGPIQNRSFEQGVTEAPIDIVPPVDPQGDTLDYTVIELPDEGVVLLGSVAIALNQVLTEAQVVGLTYTVGNDADAGGVLGFQVSDGTNVTNLSVNLDVQPAVSATYVGTSAADRLDGGAGGDELLGLAGADILLGGSGNDRLDGGTDADRMSGGGGDDTYVVDDLSDVVVETRLGGIDMVEASVSHTLALRVETLTLTGLANIDGVGARGANVIVGNGGDNVLDGGLGPDTLTGGAGSDSFVFGSRYAIIDTITDFEVGVDTIRLDNAIFTRLGSDGTLNARTFSLAPPGDANDRVRYDSATGALLYDVDGDGAKAAKQFAQLEAGLALSAQDFMVV